MTYFEDVSKVEDENGSSWGCIMEVCNGAGYFMMTRKNIKSMLPFATLSALVACGFTGGCQSENKGQFLYVKFGVSGLFRQYKGKGMLEVCVFLYR